MITIWSFFDYHRDKQTGTFNTIDRKLRWVVPGLYHILMIVLWWGIMNNWSFNPPVISV